MGSGASSAGVPEAQAMMDSHGLSPAEAKAGDTEHNRHVVAVRACGRIAKVAGDSGKVSIDEALHELLSMLHNNPDEASLRELLVSVSDGEGMVDASEFEAAAAKAADEHDNGEYLHKEVQQEVQRFGAVFDLLMEKLRWCDAWSEESKKLWWDELRKAVAKGELVVNHHDEYGNTLLIIAVMGRSIDVVEYLLEHHASPNAQNASGFCPLHYASANPEPGTDENRKLSLDAMKLLLKAGADPSLCEKSAGCTPLHYAASAGDMPKVEALLAAGAKASTRDRFSFLPKDYAETAGQTEMASFLVERAAKEGVTDTPVKDWQQHTDNATGRVFWYNHSTGESSWEKPASAGGAAPQASSGDRTATHANPMSVPPERAGAGLRAIWQRTAYAEGCKRVVSKTKRLARQAALEQAKRHQAEVMLHGNSGSGSMGSLSMEHSREMQNQIAMLQAELQKAQEHERILQEHETEMQTANQELEAAHERKMEEMAKKMEAANTSASDAKAYQEQMAAMKADHEKNMAETEAKIKAEFEAKAKAAEERHQQEAEQRAKEMESKLEAQMGLVASKMEKLESELQKEVEEKKKYYNEVEDLKGTIRVYARVRPLAKYEIAKSCKEVVTIKPSKIDMEVIHSRKDPRNKGQFIQEPKNFTFDMCFGPGNTQEDVFADTKRLMQQTLDGFNVCIFACKYGQTGAGKTFTMAGEETPDGSLLGIMPRAINELYDLFAKFSRRFTFEVELYMCELHIDDLLDLLSTEPNPKKRPKLAVKKDRKGVVYVDNINVVSINSKDELNAHVAKGMGARHVAATKMNAESSRSHLITSIIVKSENLKTKVSTIGKLTLVDLAGSERGDKTGATGETAKEGMAINKSLSALGNVIGALSSGQKHIPYRDHLLTQLMQDSLGGNAKTLMFVNVSPADYNADETIGSLTFAERCKKVTNTASAGVDTKEIAALRKELESLKKAAGK